MTDREIFRLWTALDGSTRYDQARASQRPSNTTPRAEHTGKAGIPDRAPCRPEPSVHSGLRVLGHIGAGCEWSGGSAIDGAAAYDGDGDAMRPVGGRRDEGKSE
jgi:hypothetical protein